MKWLTLEQIKAQLRIEPGFTAEDKLLEMYGSSAENTVLKYMNRTYYDVIESYGGIPDDVLHATLMLVDASYHHRSPASTQNKRTHSTVKSKDLINWTEGVRQYSVGTPDDTIEQNMIRTDGYGNGMYALGDSYVSLNWRFILNDADSFGGQLDSNMLFSRNLEEDWMRLEDENGNAFLAIPRGAEGEPDDAQIYTAAAPIQVGDETWWHYYGLSGDHGYAEYPRTGYGSAVKLIA